MLQAVGLVCVSRGVERVLERHPRWQAQRDPTPTGSSELPKASPRNRRKSRKNFSLGSSGNSGVAMLQAVGLVCVSRGVERVLERHPRWQAQRDPTPKGSSELSKASPRNPRKSRKNFSLGSSGNSGVAMLQAVGLVCVSRGVERVLERHPRWQAQRDPTPKGSSELSKASPRKPRKSRKNQIFATKTQVDPRSGATALATPRIRGICAQWTRSVLRPLCAR